MTGNLLRAFRLLWPVCVLATAVAGLTGCGTVTAPWLPETTVAPLAGEDLSGPCTYSLRLAQATPALSNNQPGNPIPVTFVPQTGVLVIFERDDSITLFDDPTLIATAQKLQMAMLYANQCNAASFDDLQADAAKGPGRALFQALDQFAVSTAHPELATANVVLNGFSAGGYLAVSLLNAYPSRVLGAVPYAPASGYYDLDQLRVTAGGAKIPMLILASGNDIAAGTHRPYNLFLRGWQENAPWGFGVQHLVNHCCTDSVAPLLEPWLTAVMQKDLQASAAGQTVRNQQAVPAPPTVLFQFSFDNLFDAIGWEDFDISSASILPSTAGGSQPAWLPDVETAKAWLTWVTNPKGN